MNLHSDGTPADDYGGTEIVEIDLKNDIFNYTFPLDGTIPVERAKRLAAESIAQQIVDKIEPEFREMPGFELMKYRLIIKKHE